MTHDEIFEQDIKDRIRAYPDDLELQDTLKKALQVMTKTKYAYNFYWLGRPIIQGPPDLQAYQEIIWNFKPDLIIETGIARGGSLIFFASMIALLEYCGEIDKGDVLGIDVDIREHNKQAILAHPLNKKITMYEGSSIDNQIIEKVKKFAKNKKRILLFLDSNHTHDHVLEELRAYAPLVSVGGYCVVCDTGIEDIKTDFSGERPWGQGNSPKSALVEYLKENDSFEIENYYDRKIMITCATDGFLKRIK